MTEIKKALDKLQETKSETGRDNKPEVLPDLTFHFQKFKTQIDYPSDRQAERMARSSATSALVAAKLWCTDVLMGTRRGLVLWANASYRDENNQTVSGWGYGNGKTMLAKMAYNAVSSNLDRLLPNGEIIPDRSGKFLTTEQYKDGIMKSYEDGSTLRYVREFWGASFVILDDFGTEHVKADSMSWWHEQLYKLFNYAYDAKQAFLITSNLPPEAMQERMGGKNWSRVYGMCQARGFVNMSRIPDQRAK